MISNYTSEKTKEGSGKMLRDREESRQTEYEIVLLDELVPQDHLLRKVDRAVDFSFIHDLCKPLYTENTGRPAIEPEFPFRMLLLGYLYVIKSEVKLAEAVNKTLDSNGLCGKIYREGAGSCDDQRQTGTAIHSHQAAKGGWWKDMYGKTIWTILQPLPRPSMARDCTAGERKRLSDHSLRRRKTMAFALLACSEFRTCGSSAS